MIAVRTETPVMAYEVPSRVKVSLGLDLVLTLANEGVLAGVKDSSGTIGVARMRSEALRALPDFPHFTGSEECIDGFLLGGGSGCIPGLANVFPHYHVALAERAAAGDWAAAATPPVDYGSAPWHLIGRPAAARCFGSIRTVRCVRSRPVSR